MTARSTARGLLWCTAFVLGPYVAAVLTLLAWSWGRGSGSPTPCEGLGFGCTLSPPTGALLVTFMSAPFAVLATGVAWLLVLALQHSPARRWTGLAQGALAATVVLLGGGALAVHVLR